MALSFFEHCFLNMGNFRGWHILCPSRHPELCPAVNISVQGDRVLDAAYFLENPVVLQSCSGLQAILCILFPTCHYKINRRPWMLNGGPVGSTSLEALWSTREGFD